MSTAKPFLREIGLSKRRSKTALCKTENSKPEVKEANYYKSIEEALLGFKDSSLSNFGKSRYNKSALGMIG